MIGGNHNNKVIVISNSFEDPFDDFTDWIYLITYLMMTENFFLFKAKYPIHLILLYPIEENLAKIIIFIGVLLFFSQTTLE
jgi:hypothetical protein